MKKLVVVADDFGLCESVNNGILDAHKKGIVTELSLMLGSPATEHALKIAKEQGVTNVGIHMLLKNWRDTGHLVHMPDYVKMFEELSAEEIAELAKAELAEFEAIVRAIAYKRASARKPFYLFRYASTCKTNKEDICPTNHSSSTLSPSKILVRTTKPTNSLT